METVLAQPHRGSATLQIVDLACRRVLTRYPIALKATHELYFHTSLYGSSECLAHAADENDIRIEYAYAALGSVQTGYVGQAYVAAVAPRLAVYDVCCGRGDG